MFVIWASGERPDSKEEARGQTGARSGPINGEGASLWKLMCKESNAYFFLPKKVRTPYVHFIEFFFFLTFEQLQIANTGGDWNLGANDHDELDINIIRFKFV